MHDAVLVGGVQRFGGLDSQPSDSREVLPAIP